MSEWNSVLAVYGALWAIDGVRLAPRRVLTLHRGWRARGGTMHFGRIAWLGAWPGNWRATTADVPLTLSPAGICNRPAGTTGRPAEVPQTAQAWRWEDVREVGVADGWIFVNGARFCPNTGHVPAPELLALAQLASPAREKRIRLRLQWWFRPAHLRRRARVLRERTATPATLNSLCLVLMSALAIYLATGGSAAVAPEWAHALAFQLPLLLGYFVLLHVGAIATAWLALPRLKAAGPGPDKRRGGLMSALFFPPQALRLRTLLAENFFPPQHPAAVALALGRESERARWAFQALADLRWPIDDRNDPPLAREVTAWYRTALEAVLTPALTSAGLPPKTLLAPPAPNSPASCAFCPRCRDQFTAGPTICPHGVVLQPIARESRSSND